MSIHVLCDHVPYYAVQPILPCYRGNNKYHRFPKPGGRSANKRRPVNLASLAQGIEHRSSTSRVLVRVQGEAVIYDGCKGRPETKAAGARDRKAGTKWGGVVVTSLMDIHQSCPPRCSTARRPYSRGTDLNSADGGPETGASVPRTSGSLSFPNLAPKPKPYNNAGGAVTGAPGVGGRRDVWL